MQPTLKFSDVLHERPPPSGIDVICKLQHFSIITYAFDPARFAGVMPKRFKLDTVQVDGREKALISVVPFIDVSFTSAVIPFPKFRMGQTNYRIYIIDTLTGEKCLWFLGTTLDSWARIIPYYLWKLPWYAGEIQFDCTQRKDGAYERYAMETVATWAPASVELTIGHDLELPGFPDTETGLVFLTHPLRGYYHRRDGKLGTYHVWHKQLQVTPARLKRAYFELLARTGLVTLDEQQCPHSVLIDPANEFTIYLPPKIIE